ncbi:MAG: dihydrofolate reductase [Bacteroidetes bacterium]|nr:MAG: dihydrofolate reductase [Bacteroidota bacterium]
MIISMIVAADEKNGIGHNNQLLCHLPADLKFFKQTTTGHCIVMGRKTYESIGKPLPNRTNIIISSNPQFKADGIVSVSSLQSAVNYAKEMGETELMITGGATIYDQAMPMVDKIYLTRIHHTFIEADTFFSGIDETKFMLVKTQPQEADNVNEYGFSFEVWERRV